MKFEDKMKSKNVFSTLILPLILVLGLGMAHSPTRAAVLDPHDPQIPLAGKPTWNLLYLD